MNTFKRKSLYAAVAGLSALGAAGTANAVVVNPDGLGQVLIYPYYTVRSDAAGNAYATLLSVVNSTGSGKAVKVRFLEGKNSREVLDFNLYLSPYDVWTAAVLPTSDGAGIITLDKSCTTPVVSSDSANPTRFVNYAYTGSNDDKADQSLDRTREGYIEIIQMGEIYEPSDTFDTIVHDNGVPECDLDVLVQDAPFDTYGTYRGGLFGSLTMINVTAGTDYTVDPLALDDFSGDNLWFEPGSIRPDLTDSNQFSAVIYSQGFFGGFLEGVADYWDLSARPGVDAVSAVLMHDNLLNEFVLDKATKSGTDWVITMPTKRFYVANGTGNTTNSLFQRNFDGNKGACDDIVLTRYDREERTVKSGISFSPPPPTPTDSICWEANVISFASSNVLGSKNVANLPTTFENGWANLNFWPATSAVQTAGKHMLVNPDSLNTYYGLPTIGFAVQTFNNGTLQVGGVGVQSTYGGSFQHKQTRRINFVN
jgi:hypothetical protein